MMVRALFNERRRRQVQDALRKGDANELLKQRNRAEAWGYDVRFGDNHQLPLGMLIKFGKMGFRFMGSQDGHAIIKIEGPGYEDSKPIELEAGRRKAISVNGGKGPENFVITVLEAPDPSGQAVITACVTEMRVG